MGKIFYLMGKSASGKDTVYRRLLEMMTELHRVIPFTTRPARAGEAEGVEYHFVAPDRLENLTAAGLQALLAAEPQKDSRAYGKIVTEFTWYFTALLGESDAARLAEGDSIELEFSRYYTGTVKARVQSISAVENGQCAVIFALKDALSETISMRSSSAEIVFSTVEGLQVPLRAVHVGEDGKSFVYCLTSGRVEKKNVQILHFAPQAAIPER